MVLAFRREQSTYVVCEGRLRDIDPAKDYEVAMYRAYAPEKPVNLPGAALRHLRLEINECPGSLLVEYRDATRPTQPPKGE